MKTKQVKTVVEEIGDTITLHDLDIGGVEYHLTIKNDNGRLFLSFNGQKSQSYAQDFFHTEDFNIKISEKKKITFSRHQFRPSHDHDDNESLQIHKKTKELLWRSRFPYQSEDYEFFEVDFGPETVNY